MKPMKISNCAWPERTIPYFQTMKNRQNSQPTKASRPSSTFGRERRRVVQIGGISVESATTPVAMLIK